MYQKSNETGLQPLIENLYGEPFRAQMDRDWKECDRLHKLIDKLTKKKEPNAPEIR